MLVRLNSDQDPRELEGEQFGWVLRSRRGRVAASLGVNELLSQMRMKISETRRWREGGGLEGAR